MKGYKGFNKELKCRNMQFEVGKEEFSVDGRLELCENGLHFCKFPLDVVKYYDFNDSRFAEVESIGEVVDNNLDEDPDKDSKVCTNKLKLCTELGISGLIEATIDYINENVDNSKEQKLMEPENEIEDDKNAINYGSVADNKGEKSLAGSTGEGSSAINTGICSIASNTGVKSFATNTGHNSRANNIGNDTVATNTGSFSSAINTGDKGAAIVTGICSAATNTGDNSAANATGEKSIAVALGYNAIAKGTLGNWLVLAEWMCDGLNDGCTIKDVQSFKVDGNTILPDTFYKLKDGKPVVATIDEGMKGVIELDLKLRD